ncbi:hypothetical protein ACOQFV_01640 [Nocardiopsis changdeensis]|uniref:Uncharacterized protein n=1 Tax=Nocardiopsis changdeensis TaxID=2831969 RepID=A0ABX8BJI2_9ACTN|nr:MULTISPECIES: hypothetical protein [Nocardiopsis]QUX22366.1 hypothetical protein KGD84_29220 [Nocardiopsis changdeensis]QYX38308.1 hypothetical protein K1J57_06605 [Nocardiopsis sp. MT53]
MSREGIEHALNRVRGELKRITLNLADLEDHVGHRMLKGADLRGLTRERWEHAERHVHRLWTTYDAFRRTVEEATDHHGQGGGHHSDQVRMTFLLTGPCLELPLEKAPLHERGLLDTDTEHITLAEAVARMTADYEEVTEVVSAAETAWNSLHPRLADLDSLWREVGTLSDMIEEAGDERDDESLRSELAGIGDTVRRDPLSLLGADRRVDTSGMERLRKRLEAARGELRDALRMRDSYRESTARLVSAVDDLEAVLAALRERRAHVVGRIREPRAIDVPDPVPALRARIAEMDALRSRGRWRELGVLLGETQAAVHAASDDARERGENLEGLLERRDELRGRLESYRARSVRLGLAEEPEVAGLHARAHRELWTAPGDLRAATVALAAYRRALEEPGVTETTQDRTTPGPDASDGESDGGVSR